MDKKNPHVAIVILCFNGIEFTKEFLPEVINSTYPNMSVWIADNHSDDGLVPHVQVHFPSVQIVEMASNEGFAGGYNTALSQIEADYFVLLNQDATVEKDWIEPVIATMESRPELAAAQPKILSQKEQSNFEHAGASGGFIDFLGYPFCRGRLFHIVETDSGQYQEPMDCFWASGAAMFVRADLFKKFGGFDSDFFAHMEEIDLCWRLQNAGYQIAVVPDGVVYHVGGGILPYESANKLYLNYRNSLVMLHKNLAPSSFLITMVIRYLLDVVAAYRELFSGNFKAYKAIARSHFYYLGNLFKIHRKRTAIRELVDRERIEEPVRNGIYQKSLIWQFFIKGIKTFDRLGFDQ